MVMDAKPLMFGKAARLYEMLHESATIEYIDGVECQVWRGRIQDAYREVRPKLSSAHYSRIMRGLKQTGSITQLQRGARNMETIIALHHEPDVDQWRAYEQSPLTARIDVATLKQNYEQKEAELRDEVQQLRERVKAVEAKVGIIPET